MWAGHRKHLLLATAILEIATGLCLIALPAVAFSGLLRIESPAAEAIVIARLAGAALLAIGVASWVARSDTTRTPSQLGLLSGLLIYNIGATLLLAFAGAVLHMAGFLLWPAVAIHAVLTVWCFACLLGNR